MQQNSAVIMLLSNPYHPDDRVRNEALALCENGYKVTILAWDRTGRLPKHDQDGPIVVERAGFVGKYEQRTGQIPYFIRLWMWFIKKSIETKPNILHAHDFDTLPAAVLACLLLPGTKVVFDAHENYYALHKIYLPGVVARVIRLMELCIVPRSDLVIAACQANAAHYQQYAKNKVVIINNWKPLASYRPAPTILRQYQERLKINGRIVVAYIGVMSRNRLILPLIEAIRARPNYFLILGGNGLDESLVRSACQNCDNIYYPGYIPSNEVPVYTALADIIYYGLSPSHPYASYNAPNKLYEALAAGNAVLAMDMGGELSEVMRKVGCGILLSSGSVDAIGEALDYMANPDVLLEMKQKSAHAGLGTYNWEYAKQRLLQAYALL
jgi:glycosyltransferase involved in cell wall biosynthesis